MNRTDVHAPKNFNPADYELVDYLDLKAPEYVPGFPGAVEAYAKAMELYRLRILEHFPDWRTGGTDHTSVFQCNHCGQGGLRWAAVVIHKPTGAKLVIGDQCATNKLELTRDEFKMKYIKDRAALEAAAAANLARKQAFREDNPDVVDFLELMEKLETEWREENERLNDEYDIAVEASWKAGNSGQGVRAGRNTKYAPHAFVNDMVHTFNRKGELSEAQTAAVRKFIPGYQRWLDSQARRAEEAAAITAEFPTGRVTVEGTVTSIKHYDNGYESWVKMLVTLEDGNKVFGSIPAAISDVEKGDRVRFAAAFEVSGDDEHFGFYKRPTKAEVI